MLAPSFIKLEGDSPARYCAALAFAGVTLPLWFSPNDPADIVDAEGRVVFTIDVHRERPDEEVDVIAIRLIQAINVCGGFVYQPPISPVLP